MATSRGSRSGAAGLTRVKAKLKLAIENGNFYEAHQMYRTMYFRLQSQKKYEELEPLLYEGSLLLFENDQISSGVDLAKLYVQILGQSDFPKSEEVFRKIAKLYSFIPSSCPERDAIMASAIQWSAPKEDKSFGSPRLHQIMAYTLWNSKRYPESRHHFLQSRDGTGCGTMLAEFQLSKGYPREFDIFVVGTVLQLICLKKHIVAAFTLKSYTENHPSIKKKGPPYGQPLLNFVWLLLLAIEHKNSLTEFTVLIEKYKIALKQDPTFLSYVDKIGQQFFNLPPPERPRQSGGMFSGILDSFMTAFSENEQCDETQQGSSISMETEDLD